MRPKGTESTNETKPGWGIRHIYLNEQTLLDRGGVYWLRKCHIYSQINKLKG